MERIEDKSICTGCGICCKSCGCDYFVSDLRDDSIEGIEAMLDSGRVSIVATFISSYLPNGQLTINPILSLRARNINREEIDLLSFKTTCASLEENGCYYSLEDRPGGGAALKPSLNHDCKSTANMIDEVQKWEVYQKKLARIVKRRTGMGVYNKLQEDVENLFYNADIGNISGVSEDEIEDIKELLPVLMVAYPEAYERAKKRSNQGSMLRVLRPKKKTTLGR